MTASFNQRYALLVYSLPALVILSSIFLALNPSTQAAPGISIGITYDLTFTAPLLYLILIWNKKVPKITVVPVFILGLVLGNLLLEPSKQYHLHLISTFVLPLIELFALSTIVYQVYKTVRIYKSLGRTHFDFYDMLKTSAVQSFGYPAFAKVLASEVAMVYYTFFAWKKPALLANTFSGYNQSVLIAIFGVVIFLILNETFIVHLLIHQYQVIAWILLIGSVYTALQLFAHIKALRQRQSIIETDTLWLKYGLFGDVRISRSDIERIEAASYDLDLKGRKIARLAFLGEMEPHNLVLFLKTPIKIEKMYGLTQNCDTLLFSIDDPDRFIALLSSEFKR